MQTEIRRPIKFLREDVYWERLSSILLALSTDYPIMTNWWTDTWSRTAHIVTMAKVIWQKTISHVCKRNPVDILFYSPGGSTRREVGPAMCIWDNHFGEGEIVGGQRCYHSRKNDGSFLYALRCDHCVSLTIRPQFAIECFRNSNQQGMGHFAATFWGGRVWPICERHGLSHAKENVLISSTVSAQYTNVTDRPTDRPRNGNIDRKRRNGKKVSYWPVQLATSPVNPFMQLHR